MKSEVKLERGQRWRVDNLSKRHCREIVGVNDKGQIYFQVSSTGRRDMIEGRSFREWIKRQGASLAPDLTPRQAAREKADERELSKAIEQAGRVTFRLKELYPFFDLAMDAMDGPKKKQLRQDIANAILGKEEN